MNSVNGNYNITQQLQISK